MGFNADAFRQADLQPRTIEVPTPELKQWFDEGASPVFVVRGLTGEEFYLVRDAVNRRRDIQAIASQLMSGDGEAIAAAIEEFYGSVPEEFARRVEIVIHGTVDPDLNRDMAMKLFKNFPSSAHVIAESILRATGEGATVGESSGSGETPASATTST